MNDQERLATLATAAAARVINGMALGLGSGTTAEAFVRALGRRIETEGLLVQGVATSQRTERVALEAGVPLIELHDSPQLDLGFDGADEIDPDLNLVKGRGGALLFEKVVAEACQQWIIVAASEKLVVQLGLRIGVPVEVVQFGWEATAAKLSRFADAVKRRELNSGAPFLTDSGNFVLDCHTGSIADPLTLAHEIKMTTGVVEHGIFTGLADEAMVIDADGNVSSVY